MMRCKQTQQKKQQNGKQGKEEHAKHTQRGAKNQEGIPKNQREAKENQEKNRINKHKQRMSINLAQSPWSKGGSVIVDKVHEHLQVALDAYNSQITPLTEIPKKLQEYPNPREEKVRLAMH